MRIAYLTDSRLPSSQANGVHVMRMADAWTDEGHDVLVVARPGVHGESDTLAYYGLRNPVRLALVDDPGPPVVRTLVRRARVRNLLSHDEPFDLLYGRSANLLYGSRHLGIPMMYEMHQLSLEGRARRIERRLLECTAIERVIAISHALANDVRAAFHVGVELRVVHDAADPPSTPMTEEDLVPDERPRVGYAGSFYPGRGTELIGQMADLMPEIQIQVAGSPTLPPELNRPNISSHGRLRPSEMSSFYRGLDIALAPYQRTVTVAGGGGDISRWMSPMKVFEYMAHGLVIVATDLPVLREVLDESFAVLLPPDDPAAWAEAVRSLRDDPERLRAMRRAALCEFENGHTWNDRAGSVLAGFRP